MTEIDPFEYGRLVGQVEALEKTLESHKARMDGHAQRLRILERIVWLATGVFVFLGVLPKLSDLIRLLTQ